MKLKSKCCKKYKREADCCKRCPLGAELTRNQRRKLLKKARKKLAKAA